MSNSNTNVPANVAAALMNMSRGPPGQIAQTISYLTGNTGRGVAPPGVSITNNNGDTYTYPRREVRPPKNVINAILKVIAIFVLFFSIVIPVLFTSNSTMVEGFRKSAQLKMAMDNVTVENVTNRPNETVMPFVLMHRDLSTGANFTGETRRAVIEAVKVAESGIIPGGGLNGLGITNISKNQFEAIANANRTELSVGKVNEITPAVIRNDQHLAQMETEMMRAELAMVEASNTARENMMAEMEEALAECAALRQQMLGRSNGNTALVPVNSFMNTSYCYDETGKLMSPFKARQNIMKIFSEINGVILDAVGNNVDSALKNAKRQEAIKNANAQARINTANARALRQAVRNNKAAEEQAARNKKAANEEANRQRRLRNVQTEVEIAELRRESKRANLELTQFESEVRNATNVHVRNLTALNETLNRTSNNLTNTKEVGALKARLNACIESARNLANLSKKAVTKGFWQDVGRDIIGVLTLKSIRDSKIEEYSKYDFAQKAVWGAVDLIKLWSGHKVIDSITRMKLKLSFFRFFWFCVSLTPQLTLLDLPKFSYYTAMSVILVLRNIKRPREESFGPLRNFASGFKQRISEDFSKYRESYGEEARVRNRPRPRVETAPAPAPAPAPAARRPPRQGENIRTLFGRQQARVNARRRQANANTGDPGDPP